jgi:hypothetical protein
MESQHSSSHITFLASQLQYWNENQTPIQLKISSLYNLSLEIHILYLGQFFS